MKLNHYITKKKSDIGTIASKISKKCFSDGSIVKVITERDIVSNKVSKAKNFLRYCRNSKNKNIYGHVGIYQYKTSILKKFVNFSQSKKEIKHRLEQLRAIENGINIDVVYSRNKSLGIDTIQDFVEIKKKKEYKI